MKQPKFLRLMSVGKMRLASRIACHLALVSAFTASQVHAVNIPTVLIGNPGNAPDTEIMNTDWTTGYGSVPYQFRMGKTEVTNSQYVQFLNAVAAADPFALYNTEMGSQTWGGIVRLGSSGTYTYAVKAPAIGQGPGGADYMYENKPVVYVSWYDALRFANWLHNGQPVGAQDGATTEDGAYTFSGATSVGPRNADALWWLPSENEWYKSAYYDPIGVYNDYPTKAPTSSNLPANDTGASANFNNTGLVTGNFDFPLTDAGAYTLSDSPYGTFDQAGNVREWIETVITESYPGFRGGYWFSGHLALEARYRVYALPTSESDSFGFRVANIPEPATIHLAVLSAAALLWRRRYLSLKSIAVFATAVLPLCVCSSPSNAAAPFFMGLGDLPGGNFNSEASGVSDDGSVVVGWSSPGLTTQAFRWTQSTGMVALGPGLTVGSRANDVSADGSVVAGRRVRSGGHARPPIIEAFRWTQTGGTVGLGGFESNAYAVSADGSVVVGQGASGSRIEAFRWTQTSGMVGLGDLPGGSFESNAYAVSADGSVIVGSLASPPLAVKRSDGGRPAAWLAWATWVAALSAV
ncbi:MAG: SUMF1/EgtB/PvdO family nonheme iron enzyme [Pirellulales bacterium]